MLDLIIKNGSCYIDGNLIKTDIGVSNSKISHIGNLEHEKSKDIYDANNLIVLPSLISSTNFADFSEPNL